MDGVTTLRRHVSLLLANGHPSAERYTLGKLFTESQIVKERIDTQTATEATLLQLAVHSLLSKDAAKLFKEQLKELSNG